MYLKCEVGVVDLSDGEYQVATKGMNTVKGLSVQCIAAVCGRCQEYREMSEY
jgi:hypothetical protein